MAKKEKVNNGANEKLISAWGYFGLNLLYLIPIIGFIFVIAHCFVGSPNRKKYARGHLLTYSIYTIVIVALVVNSIYTGWFAYIIDNARDIFNKIAGWFGYSPAA